MTVPSGAIPLLPVQWSLTVMALLPLLRTSKLTESFLQVLPAPMAILKQLLVSALSGMVPTTQL